MSKIHVWDPLIRIFHWSLVIAFTIGYLSGDEESLLHIYSGYTVLGLVIFRLLWGMIGTKYARFTNFIYSPSTVFCYLKNLIEGQPSHYIGHNPAAGWMIIALLLCLIVVTVSGLKVYAIEEGLGPLAKSNSELVIISKAYADRDEDEDEEDENHGENGAEEFWEEIHEASSNFMLFLIFLHIASVAVSSYLHKENLVKAMITGTKVQQD